MLCAINHLYPVLIELPLIFIYFRTYTVCVVDAEEDVHSIEREEELQQRLLQLLRLPSVPQDSRTDTATLSQEENDGSFLSLNLKELAESLATLPITERIALPQDLLEHYGVEDVLTTDERNSRTFSTPVDPITAPNSNPPPSTKSNTTSALGSVTALLSKEKESQTRTFDFGAPTARVEPPQTTVSQPESAPTVLEQGMRSYDHSKPQHVDSSDIDQEERQLEVLLHATSGLVHAHDSRTVYEQSTHVSDVEKKMGKEQTREFDDEKTVRGQKCLESKDVTTTAELDDMLDDLLA